MLISWLDEILVDGLLIMAAQNPAKIWSLCFALDCPVNWNKHNQDSRFTNLSAENMPQINLKARLLGIVIVAIAASSNVLTACSTSAQLQTQAPESTTPTTTASQPVAQNNMDDMDHSKMDLGPADAEFDLRFIDSMIPHHEGAVVMAKAVLQNSQRPELKQLAEAVITAQTKEIQQMRQWRTAWYPKAPSEPIAWHAEMGHAMAMSDDHIKAMRMDVDLGTADAEFDKRFVDAMIPHHEGAIVMAKDVQQKSKRPEILQMATAIMTSQQAEIDQMRQWRKTWYGQ